MRVPFSVYEHCFQEEDEAVDHEIRLLKKHKLVEKRGLKGTKQIVLFQNSYKFSKQIQKYVGTY